LLFACGAQNNKQSTEVTAEIDTAVSIEEDYKTQMMYLDSVIKSNNPADYDWISALNQIKLPETIKQDNLINVYFKYNQIVNGYEVTARWLPFEPICETGYLVMNFRNITNGKSFQYFETEKYNSFDTDNITFSDGFKGYHNGDVFHFDYSFPKSYYSGRNNPIEYHAPFQFLDVDFDGEKELLIGDYSKSQGGNIYEVYKVKGNSIQLMDYPPFKDIQNSAEFDFKNKRIIIYECDRKEVYKLNSDKKTIELE